MRGCLLQIPFGCHGPWRGLRWCLHRGQRVRQLRDRCWLLRRGFFHTCFCCGLACCGSLNSGLRRGGFGGCSFAHGCGLVARLAGGGLHLRFHGWLLRRCSVLARACRFLRPCFLGAGSHDRGFASAAAKGMPALLLPAMARWKAHSDTPLSITRGIHCPLEEELHRLRAECNVPLFRASENRLLQPHPCSMPKAKAPRSIGGLCITIGRCSLLHEAAEHSAVLRTQDVAARCQCTDGQAEQIATQGGCA